MNSHLYLAHSLPIQKPEYETGYAFWELSDTEVDTAYQSQIDDFGTKFGPRLLDDRVFYFAIQRADDPGMIR